MKRSGAAGTPAGGPTGRPFALASIARSLQRMALRASLRAFGWLCAAWAGGGCATGVACRTDPVTGSERCQPTSGSYGNAVATVGIAAASWALVGCSVNGCEPPFRCNAESKMCERIPCHEGKNVCPPGYSCDLEDHVCR